MFKNLKTFFVSFAAGESEKDICVYLRSSVEKMLLIFRSVYCFLKPALHMDNLYNLFHHHRKTYFDQLHLISGHSEIDVPDPD